MRHLVLAVALTVGAGFLLAGCGIAAGGVPSSTDTPATGLDGTTQCTSYNVDIGDANDGPTNAFDTAQGLSVTESVDMVSECTNYPCETLAEAVAAVQSPTWSSGFDASKSQFAGPCS